MALNIAEALAEIAFIYKYNSDFEAKIHIDKIIRNEGLTGTPQAQQLYDKLQELRDASIALPLSR